jgi:hypothetical protein
LRFESLSRQQLQPQQDRSSAPASATPEEAFDAIVKAGSDLGTIVLARTLDFQPFQPICGLGCVFRDHNCDWL